jgi:RsiW-degrading membrane proteinase PrsW (M82 family)
MDGNRNFPSPPRQTRRLTFSEFVPIGSSKVSLLRSRLLPLGVVTIVFGFLLIALLPQVDQPTSAELFFCALGVYLGLLLLFIVYEYAGSDKPILALAFSAGVVAIVLLTPLFQVLDAPFQLVAPSADAPDFLSRWVGLFLGVGLPEELTKALPILFGLYLTLRPRPKPTKATDLLRVRGPLDGLLFGVAAGTAFTLVETLGPYMHAFGPLVMFPRLISVSGHTAYAGVFGYFIGLAAIRPGREVLLLPTGWFAAASLHAVWDASVSEPALLIASAFASFICFLGCLLKARQLDGQVSRAPAGLDGGGSIVVGASQTRPAAKATEPTFQLFVEGRAIPLRPGFELDLARLPGLANATGVVFRVTTHPTEPSIMGLQNLGAQSWTATYKGAPRRIDPQRNIRISHGTLIAFGPVQGSIRLVHEQLED